MASTSTSTSAAGDDSVKKKSVVIVDMPEELINRDILKRHFEQFGTVDRLACSVSKKYAVIHFSTAEEAEKAAINGGKIKPDAPPLKIFNRAVAELEKKPVAPPPVPSTRMVTRRKIVRTFNTSGSGTTTTSLMSGNSSAASSSNFSVETESSINRPSSSMASALQGAVPLKSSIKVSRPSPFLRKRASFGDKSTKPGTSMGRNPFSVPPRGMLSLDRRRNVFNPTSRMKPQTENETSNVSDIAGDSAESQIIAPAHETECSSSEIVLPDEDEPDIEDPNVEVPDEIVMPGGESTVSDQQDNRQAAGTTTEGIPSSTFDVDETTEDAILNDDDPDEGGDGDDPRDEDYIPDEGEDTQDTAEATTEEEGEILDDEDDENEEDEENNEGDDDVYESPLKRAEEASKKQESSTTSSGGFSFKLSTGSSSAASSSIFKLPFTSPFAIGDAPKPFSSSSFGIQLNPSNMSKIFAGNSSSSSGSQASKSEEKERSEMSKAKAGKLRSSSSQLVPNKDTISEQEKPKSSSFRLFPSFTTSKPSTTVTSSSPISFSSELKPSTFPVVKSLPSASSSATAPQIFQKKTTGLPGYSSTSSFTTRPSFQSQKDSPNPLLLSFNPDTIDAQELFTKRSNTAEERYRILEARDKIVRSRIPKTKVNVEQAKNLIGTCPDMCPEKERYMRQFQRQLVSYETLPGQDPIVDHQKAIKVYSRSAADQEDPLPHELRPGPTLDFTMHYLLRFIVPLGDNQDENLSDWYNFVWDRTRSIRKDITQQQIIDLTAVSLYEKCTRFHIHCASRLCELDVHSFDPKLNDENLMKCLQSLEHLYEDLRRRQVTCPNEPEFRAYQIMMNLNEGDALYNAQQLPAWILNSQQVQTALKLHHSVYTKNFVAFFNTVEDLPYMTSCILHRYFFQVRSLALRCFVKAHCTLPKYETAMPISTLQRMLGYGSAVQSFSYLCEAHGIHCDIEENRVIFKRKLFYLPEFPSIYREAYLIDSKLCTSVAEAVNGGPLPDIDFSSRKPQCSFDDYGQLISGDIVGARDGKAGIFIPPEPSGVSRGFGKQLIQPSVAPAGFSFGIFQQQKKEHVQPPKPLRQIESVCQDATAKLIDESVRMDVAKLSRARLEEAKKMQEQAVKKRRREQIVTTLATEHLDRLLSQHIEVFIRAQSVSRIRQFRAIEEVARSTASALVDESILLNLGISARTELILAKEYHHRVLRMLERIFQRLRARFALQKWVRFTRTKKLEREREEEKRREQLWNFPVINSYSMSTKDVFHAFCGKSSVQPSLDKVDSLSKSPENISLKLGRPKRKSDGDADPGNLPTASKVPRIDADLDYCRQVKWRQLWEFPAVNPYTKTNRQVLQAFCGNSSVNSNVSSKVATTAEKRKSQFSSSVDEDGSFLKIRKPSEKVASYRGVSQEIRQKANQSSTDLLKNIQSFLSQVKTEKQQSKNLEPYLEGVEAMNVMCPELNNSAESIELQRDDEPESHLYDDEGNLDWGMDVADERFQHSLLSGAFMEEEKLLCLIQKFSRQVREEKAKSWKTDTFLNDIDLSFIS